MLAPCESFRSRYPVKYSVRRFQTSCHHGHGQASGPLPAAGVFVSVERNLRRPERLLGLRPLGRRAEAEHQRGLVARHGRRPQRAGRPGRRADALRNGRPRLLDHHAPAGLEGLGPLRLVLRHDGRLPGVQRAVAGRPFAVGRVPAEAEQASGRIREMPTHRAARIQSDVQDDRRRDGHRRGCGLPAARDGPRHLRQFQERHRQHAGENPVRHRPGRQELPQRDHAAELYVSLPRVRADGDRVFLPPECVAQVVRILARPADGVVQGAGPLRRTAAAPRARPGRTEPLFVRHGRHRVRVPVPRCRRVRRAGRASPIAAISTCGATWRASS